MVFGACGAFDSQEFYAGLKRFLISQGYRRGFNLARESDRTSILAVTRDSLCRKFFGVLPIDQRDLPLVIATALLNQDILRTEIAMAVAKVQMNSRQAAPERLRQP